MNINLREPSTKRGIVMLITGGMVVYQTFWGSGQIDIDSLVANDHRYIGSPIYPRGIDVDRLL